MASRVDGQFKQSLRAAVLSSASEIDRAAAFRTSEIPRVIAARGLLPASLVRSSLVILFQFVNNVQKRKSAGRRSWVYGKSQPSCRATPGEIET